MTAASVPAQTTRSRAVLAWVHLMRAFVAIDRRIEQALRPHGLTHPQFEVLAHLRRVHGPAQLDLSQSLLLDKGNLCGILNRLAEDGLVERRPDPVDRRYNRVYLTTRGREVLATVIPEIDMVLEGAFGAFGPEEQDGLRRALGRLDRGVE